MVTTTNRSVRNGVIQFTVSREAKDGWLSDFVNLLTLNGNYVLGLMGERGSEVSYIRFVTEAPDDIRALLTVQGITFCEREVIAVALRTLGDLDGILRCLKGGEVSVTYTYSLMIHGDNQSGLVIMVDDIAMGAEVLEKSGYKILRQNDLSR